MQSFMTPANGRSTPESIARKRKLAEAMMANGMDSSPVGHWTQGGSRIAQALMGGLESRRADSAEAAGQQSARDALAKALNGGDKSAMLEAVNNPWMNNQSLEMVGNQWDRMNQPPPNPELKDLGNGQFMQYDPRDPQGSNEMWTPEGYQPPPGHRLITGEEATQMGLPPGAYNLDPEGKISQIGGSDTNVNINNAPPGQPMMGTIPPGFAAVQDPNSPSGFRMERIGGGPEDTSSADAAKQNKNMTLTDTVVDAASKARALIGRTSTGIIGQWMGYFGESEAAEINRQTEVLRSNAKIENLNAMRRESKTGGALGSVTQNETEMLANAAGALDPTAGPVRYKEALDNYELTLLRIVHGYSAGTAIFEQTREQDGPPEDDGYTVEEVQP